MRQDAEVKTGECDAALYDAELEARFLKGGLEVVFGRDVDFSDVESFVGKGELGGIDIESGDLGTGGEKGGDGCGSYIAGAACYKDVATGET